MISLIASLLIATPTPSPIEELTPIEICGLVALELWDAADMGIITNSEARDIERRCYSHYAA